MWQGPPDLAFQVAARPAEGSPAATSDGNFWDTMGAKGGQWTREFCGALGQALQSALTRLKLKEWLPQIRQHCAMNADPGRPKVPGKHSVSAGENTAQTGTPTRACE